MGLVCLYTPRHTIFRDSLALPLETVCDSRLHTGLRAVVYDSTLGVNVSGVCLHTPSAFEGSQTPHSAAALPTRSGDRVLEGVLEEDGERLGSGSAPTSTGGDIAQVDELAGLVEGKH